MTHTKRLPRRCARSRRPSVCLAPLPLLQPAGWQVGSATSKASALAGALASEFVVLCKATNARKDTALGAPVSPYRPAYVGPLVADRRGAQKKSTGLWREHWAAATAAAASAIAAGFGGRATLRKGQTGKASSSSARESPASIFFCPPLPAPPQPQPPQCSHPVWPSPV